MSIPDDITGIPNVLLTLLQSSLRVIVVSKRVRHASIALHRHRIACRLQKVSVFMRLVSAEIVFRRNDVCSRHAFEGSCKYRRCHPVVQRSFSKFCSPSSARVFTMPCSLPRYSPVPFGIQWSMNQSMRDLGPQGLCSTIATLGYFFATSDLRGSSPMDHRRSVEGTTINANLRLTPSAFAI